MLSSRAIVQSRDYSCVAQTARPYRARNGGVRATPPAPELGAVFGRAADAVGDCQHQHRDRKCKQNSHHPGELHAIGLAVDVGEPFEHADGRDRDDRAEQFLLEPRKSNINKTGWPSRVLGIVNGRHEVLIPGADHDHDEAGDDPKIAQIYNPNTPAPPLPSTALSTT